MGRLVVIAPGGERGRYERAPRDSVFLSARVSSCDGTESGVFKIRNISRNGLMAEGPIGFACGCELIIDLRNIGCVRGRVSWASEHRFGLEFDHPIDPRAVRRRV